MSPDLVDLTGVTFLRRDALDAGYTDRAIAAHVRAGVWQRVRRGAYCSGELWQSLSAADRHRVVARAVLRTAHPSSVLSHHSAAIEHGAPVWGVDLSAVHLTRTDGKAGRREAGLVHHRGVLPMRLVDTKGAVPVTEATRTALEMTTVTSVESALVTVNGLLHSGATSEAAITAMRDDVRQWPHSLTTDLVLRLADPRIESAGESRALYLCWSQQLPRPVPQVEVLDERGLVIARLDFAWPTHGVFLEFDGREKYARHRRPGESLDDYLMREKRREERICLLTGWTCIRLGWDDLSRPVVTADRIRRILARRTPQGA